MQLHLLQHAPEIPDRPHHQQDHAMQPGYPPQGLKTIILSILGFSHGPFPMTQPGKCQFQFRIIS
eukprot:9168256-Prorocentrum_lima.AAC.1